MWQRLAILSRPFASSRGGRASIGGHPRRAIVRRVEQVQSVFLPTRSFLMIRVQVRPNEPLEAALRRFKRQCNYAGIFRLAKKYAYHEKTSDRRRREERERLRNIEIGRASCRERV